MNGPQVVLVHGAWHRASCWVRVQQLLDANGVESVALDLPSCGGPSGQELGTIDDDVAAVLSVLDECTQDVVLVGHSRGGLVISEAGVHPRVGHLLYIAALMGDGTEQLEEMFSDGMDNIVIRSQIRFADGRSGFDAAAAIEAFYDDCDPLDAAAAVRELVIMNDVGGRRDTTRELPQAWQSRPTTYAVCARDRTIAPSMQRIWAGKVSQAVEWDTAHSPFVNRPDLVADLLLDRARQLQ